MQNVNESAKESLENASNTENAVDESRTVTSHVAARRRERPPLRYTEDFATPSTVSLDVIGVVRSPYKVSFVPRSFDNLLFAFCERRVPFLFTVD